MNYSVMRILVSLCILCNVSGLFGQKFDNVWPMGSFPSVMPPDKDTFNNHFVLDFTKDTMKIEKRLELKDDLFVESSALSDSSGNLLMYTNGCNIYDGKGNILPNGDSINHIVDGGPSVWLNACGAGSGYTTTRLSRFIPFFSHHRIFLIHIAFSFEFGFQYRYLLYDQIELVDGVWTVISKNNKLLDQSGCNYDITKHANGRDWWLVSQKYGTHEYKVWLITPEGIKFNSEKVFTIPFENDDLVAPSFSPDGSKYLHYNGVTYSQLFDFDRCTGVLSNPTEVHHPYCYFSFYATFSPNGRFIYLTNRDYLYQIDLQNSDTLTNRDTISKWDGLIWGCPFCPTNYFYLQTGPDGKIYCNSTGGSRFIHVIECPNEKGKACQFRPRAYKTPFFVQGNLPAFPYYRLGPIDGSACDTLGLNNVPIANFRYYPDTLEQHKIKFIDNSSYMPTDWLWTFGDGSGKTSTEVNPIYTYAKGGVYEVCETVSNAYGQDTYCRNVRVGTVATQEELQSRYFSLYPNPATSQLTIDLNESMNPGQAYDVKLYDIQGSTRYKGVMLAYAYVHTIDVQGLASGMYILELSDREGKMLRRKFVKE